MNGAKALIMSLEKEGVTNMFGILGGAILDFYDVIYDATSIRHLLMRHEQCAGHAAEGFAKVSGKVGVAVATSGPGATNLVTPIADAHCDSVPIVAITGQVMSHLIGNDAFQEADIVGITMPVTKHNFQITDPDTIPEVVRSAFKIASTRRPGPVLIDFPKDMQQKELKNKFKYPDDVNMPGYKAEIRPVHREQLKLAAKTILDAQRPAIIAGGGTIISNASNELITFAQCLSMPVATTLMAKGIIPETHPLALGMVGMHGRKAANHTISGCDVLIAVGCRFSDRITGNPQHFAPDARIIHIDIDAAEIGKNVRADIPLVGDSKLVLESLTNIINDLKEKQAVQRSGQWYEKVMNFKKEFAPFYDYDDYVPVKQQRVMKAVNNLIDDKTIIVTEVGQCQMWAAHYLNIKKPRSFITSGGLGTMGFGFPASIGVKVAKPDHKVLDVGSEGSFMMTGQELAVCVKEDIPVTVLLLDNRYLGMVMQWQDLFYEKRRSHTYLGETPNFVKYAEAFGASGIEITRPSEIDEALKNAVNSNEPWIVDVRVDVSEHILPMVEPGGRIDKMIEKKMLCTG